MRLFEGKFDLLIGVFSLIFGDFIEILVIYIYRVLKTCLRVSWNVGKLLFTIEARGKNAFSGGGLY